MKYVLSFSPTFTPGASGVGTLDFSGFAGFALKNLVAVVNVTRGAIIYAPAMGAAFGFSAFGSGIITLQVATTGHDSGDVLEALYDDAGAGNTSLAGIAATNALQTSQLLSLSNLQTQQAAYLASMDGKLPALLTSAPPSATGAEPFRIANSDIFRTSFVDAGAGLLASGLTLLQTGSGMTISQSTGNLLVATGTTTNAQTLIRSNRTFAGPFNFRAKLTASQRIINQQFAFWLADLLGTGLAYTTDGTGTNITVTWPTGENPFTSYSVGQTVNLGVISGTGVPGRYCIQSVSGDTTTFAGIFPATWTRSTTTATVTLLGGSHDLFTGTNTGVVSNTSDAAAITDGTKSPTSAAGATFTFTCLNAGAASGTLTYQDTTRVFAASASGTLTVWGYNSFKVCYRDASATVANMDCTRKGYGLADTAGAINTSASGHIVQIASDGAFVDFVDSSAASSTGYQFSSRATRLENIPDETTPLYLFIEAKNGTTAPASTTTFTTGMVSVEQIGNGKVSISSISATGIARGQKVSINDIPTTVITTGLSTSANGVSTFHHAISAASTNATSVKASAGALSAIILGNTTATVKFWKLYNKASAPTVGTDTPIATIVIPPNGSFSVPFDMFPERLATGIAYAITGGVAVADTTAVAVGDVSVHLAYA